jgi:hypothetical protein
VGPGGRGVVEEEPQGSTSHTQGEATHVHHQC